MASLAVNEFAETLALQPMRPGNPKYRDIFEWISSAKSIPDDYPPDYVPIPGIPKHVWTTLGDIVKEREHAAVMQARPSDWIVLRLDIRGMSHLKPKLGIRREFSDKMASGMQHTAYSLAVHLHAVIAFTQSDEITVIIGPSKNPNGQHIFKGTRDKLISISAAQASLFFNQAFFNGNPTSMDTPLIAFDCRMSVWETEREALQVIARRAEDCALNGLSDAAMAVNKSWVGLNSQVKLSNLHNAGRLPLPPHQAYGTLFYRTLEQVSSSDRRAYVKRPSDGPCLTFLAARLGLAVSSTSIATPCVSSISSSLTAATL